MINFADYKFKLGQGVRIKTKDGVILGTFKKLAADESRIEIEHPQRRDGTKLGKFRLIYRSDILDIKVDCVGDSGYEDGNEPLEAKAFKPALSKVQRDRIFRMMENAQLINRNDAKYQEALLEISAEVAIGIHAENTDLGRLSDAHFLQISTPAKIYVFDLKQLNAQRLFDDLRPVLETSTTTKICFNSRYLLDNFKSRFNVKMVEFFDLLVVLSIERETEFKSLGDCVKEILGITIEDNHSHLLRRPVSLDQLVALSAKVAFLIPLYYQIKNPFIKEKYGEATEEYGTINEENFCDEAFSVENEKLQGVLKKSKNR